MVVLLNDINGVIGRDGDAGGAVEVAGVGAGLAPLADKAAFQVEDGDAVEVFVGDENFAAGADGHADGHYPLAVAAAAAPAEFAQVVLVPVEDADTHQGGAGGVAVVQHQDAPVGGEGAVVGIDEAPPALVGGQADGFEVFHRAGGVGNSIGNDSIGSGDCGSHKVVSLESAGAEQYAPAGGRRNRARPASTGSPGERRRERGRAQRRPLDRVAPGSVRPAGIPGWR